MTRRPRKATRQLVTLALLAFLAQALVPRASWYVHRHAGDGHEHVHGWDGTRVAGSTASLRDFLPYEHDGAGPHAQHGDDPGEATAHEHGADAFGHEHEHPHDHVHAATAGSGRQRPRTGGPVLLATHDAAHAHAQAPFQTVVATRVAHVAPPRPHLERRPIALASLADARTYAPRARGPPPAV